MKNKIKRIILALAFLACFLPWSNPLLAQIAAINAPVNPLFNPNRIISDAEMTDYSCMDLSEIDVFLKNKTGVLGNYEIIDPSTGLNLKASEIIYNAAQNYKINPKVLLVLLQKEQSLVENSNPTKYNFDWAAGYARCDSCGPLDPTALRYKGFAKQVDGAAGALRFYFDNQTESWTKKPGLIYNIDSIPVIPANLATANLYTYTPHFQGNYNFWKIWNRWFSQKFPDGMIVQSADNDRIYLIQSGKILPFKNKAVFLSRYSSKSITFVSQADLDVFSKGPEIKFLNYSLVKTDKSHTYLLVDEKKRLIDKTAMKYYGFASDEVMSGTEEDLTVYFESAPVSVKAKYPLGALMLDTKNNSYFLVEDSIKHPIYDKEIIKINFPNKKIIKTTTTALKKYQEGDPILLNDGVWVKTNSSPDVFIISNGNRRLITDETTFEALGGQQENLITINEKTLAVHPLGDPISLNNQSVSLTQANNN